MLRAARRDPQAFRAFYRANADWLYRWLLARVDDPHVASDLTAETFARALEGVGRFRGSAPGSGTAWLFGIARNLVRNTYERRRLERAARERLGMVARPYAPEEHEAVEERVDADALAGEIADALGVLSDELREALSLRVVEGLSYDELAAATGISESNARMRVSRALRALSARLSPREGGIR
jgi:RNA polymerase sigma-70 factor (ECF subfamily)